MRQEPTLHRGPKNCPAAAPPILAHDADYSRRHNRLVGRIPEIKNCERAVHPRWIISVGFTVLAVDLTGC
jgi:hypothetical protein